ncbi:interleukin-31 receptor subunit alpha [Toxotes jaculatrix]|uniref:interleukin-31 receptor subunit alpha n=1 Tax=Toxotes jaculatrix TaxID=941984 RepID=UPI001B3AE463|nr:interleukin-31 receptor subunit alpha [Toxotes jaculatrix]
MERHPAVVWTFLLGAGLALVLPPALSITTSKAFPRPLQLIRCVFLNRANITCHWEPGDTPATHYTLRIQRMPGAVLLAANSSLKTFTCTTSNTSCTAGIGSSSVRFTFCITVTAHSRSRDISSSPRCQPGRIEVMLPPAILNSVKSVKGTPRCLNVIWSRTLSVFPVSDSEIKAGKLNSQIEVTTLGQLDLKVKNVTVEDYSFLVCLFRPDTSYTVRLRHRYLGPESPWSPWSNARQGRTAEDAPSAAPAFWRRVEQADKNGLRLVSLLWKPLPHFLANGRSLFYNVTCQTESAQILNDHGSCRDLHHTRTSCTLLLPTERCSCALTASNSAGTSPEAQIWLLGASETEPPSPSQITASPLDDNSFDVSWTAPVDQSVSGFVVEWFVVREKNSSIRHWEKLNSSCTSLVITEGVKPMERYAVSVKVLYGERGPGKNRTLHIYTRQGAPSAGPNVEVQQISRGTVELSWRPVPVELLRGFIRNYTLFYTAANQPARSVFVPGHVHRYSLENLSPGNYYIFMQANTDAGTGAAGRMVNVHIGSEEISIVMCVVLPLILTLMVLALMACLAQNNMVKQKLCQFVPDPSNSSLAHWKPKTTLESMKPLPVLEKPEIKNSEVILLGESKLQNNGPDQATSYQSICNLETYYSHRYSPPPVSGSQTPQNTRTSERKFNRSPVRAKTTSNTDLSSCPSIYSSVVFSQTLKNPPAPIWSPSNHQLNEWQRSAVSVSDVKLQLAGASEPPEGRRAGGQQKGHSTTSLDSPRSPTDELKTSHILPKNHQSPVSFSDVSIVSPSSFSLSHPPEVSSPKHLLSQWGINLVPSFQPSIFTNPNSPSANSSSLLPPVFVDFSYCPVECDPYISPS